MSTLDALKAYSEAQKEFAVTQKNARSQFSDKQATLGTTNASHVDQGISSILKAQADLIQTKSEDSNNTIQLVVGITNTIASATKAIGTKNTDPNSTESQKNWNAVIAGAVQLAGVIASFVAAKQVTAAKINKDLTLINAGQKQAGDLQGI